MFEKSAAYFFFGLLAVVTLVAFLIALPYVPAIIFAAALAVVFRPIYDRLLRRLKRPSLAAWATIILAALIVFIPLTFIGYEVFLEAHIMYANLSSHGFQLPSGGSGALQELWGRVSPKFAANSQELGQKALTWVINSTGFFFSHLLLILLNIFICIMALFYFLADGDRIKEWMVAFSPLPREHDQMILDRMNKTVGSVFRGALIIALLQGVISGIGFVMFGVPNPALWGTAAAIAALIPGFGTALVLVPAVIYALAFRGMLPGIGLAVWAATAIGLVDNVLGPHLSSKGARLHPFAIFIAVIGGLAFFGPLGFVIGPLVYSLLFTLIDIYASARLAPPKPKPRKAK